MLSNAEYAFLNHLPTSELPPAFEGFAMFSLELPDGTDLWTVTGKHETGKVAYRKADKLSDKEQKAANLKMYAERAAAGLPIFDESDESDDDGGQVDSWTEFFANDTTHKGGRPGSRKRVRNNSGFESLVDSAQ